MRLQSVMVHGYKRFAEKNVLYVRAPLIAVVGPNEAGKTSLLEAIRHLSLEPPVDEEEDSEEVLDWRFARREFSGRRLSGPREGDKNPKILAARFSLEAEDRKALAGLPGATVPGRTFEVTKRADGALRRRLFPPLKRELAPRHALTKMLTSAVKNRWLPVDPLPSPDGEPPGEEDEGLRDRAEALILPLGEAGENLSKPQVALVRSFGLDLSRALAKSAPKEARELPVKAAELADLEETEHPNDRAEERLFASRPVFLLFDDAERTLRSTYTWEEDIARSPALANLLALAEVDFAGLRDLATDGDRKEELQTTEMLANKTLEERFDVWKQAKLSVSLRIEPSGLEIQIRDRLTLEHTRLDERSAGLRSFVALIAFCATRAEGRKPILLVDEAENHLHYEAQADLLRVFERQKIAQTIIYTTHSVGALPEDLGGAIRVVAPQGPGRSEIRNSFWSGDPVGLTPMMLAMGATALAFTPARFAVVGEGRTEAIVLPTLLREARGGDPYRRLGFQVVPGLSEVHRDDVPDLERQAGHVVFLRDSDEGGERLELDKLSERARAEGRVLELGDGEIPGLCIEDLLRADYLVDAFNDILSRCRPSCAERLAIEELPAVGRGRFLVDWCADRGLDELSKPLIGQEVVDRGRVEDQPIIGPDRMEHVRSLYERLSAAFTPQIKNS
jgi:ABC-type transport system involved in cytochrome c biogenesis ATPase subunit